MKFPQWVVDRVVARQGRLHPFDRLAANKLAFVVVDMQNYFLLPEFAAAVASAAATIPAINKLCQAVRARGGLVVWVQTTSEKSDLHLPMHYGEAFTPERKRRRMEGLSPASAGYALHRQLDVQAGDCRIEKICYSAMVQGSSKLNEVLHQCGIETILVGGTATNVCCDSTGRDAIMQNYRTLMVEDALSAFTPAEHEWALHNWLLFFGDVLSVNEVIELLEPAGRDSRTA